MNPTDATTFALGALVREAGEDVLVAIARYAKDPEDALMDFAVVVRDDWQQRGLGKLLLTRLLTICKAHGSPGSGA